MSSTNVHIRHHFDLAKAFFTHPLNKQERQGIRLLNIVCNKGLSDDPSLRFNGLSEVVAVFGREFADTIYKNLLTAFKAARIDSRETRDSAISAAYDSADKQNIGRKIVDASMNEIYRKAILHALKTSTEAAQAGNYVGEGLAIADAIKSAKRAGIDLKTFIEANDDQITGLSMTPFFRQVLFKE